MSGRLALAKLRNLLTIKASELGNPGAKTEAIIDAVVKEYPDEIAAVSDTLIRSALARELARCRSRAPAAVEPIQATLWGNFGISRQIIVQDEHGERINKNIEICSFAEVREYADSLPSRKNRSDRKSGLLNMIEELKRHCPKEDQPLGAVWALIVKGEDDKTG